MKKIAAFTILSLLLISCDNTKQNKEADFVLIDLKKSLEEGNTGRFSLNDISEEINVIPVETSDSILFENLFIAGISGDKVISFDKTTLSSIDRINGEVKTILNKRGSGPDEYQFIIEVILDDDYINVYDTGKRGFLRYDYQGNFIDFMKNDSISTYQRMEDGNFYVCYSPFLNSDNYTAVYDQDWNFLRKGISNDRKDVELDMYFMNSLKSGNGKLFFKDTWGDTIYSVNTTIDKPYIVFYQGELKMPVDVLANIEKRNKEQDKYIGQIDYNIASKYCFLFYYFNNQEYYDIWNIETAELIYRSILELNNQSRGFPINVNGEDLNVWISHVEKDYLYCVIQAEDAIKLVPSLPEDTNPILLEIKLKK